MSKKTIIKAGWIEVANPTTVTAVGFAVAARMLLQALRKGQTKWEWLLGCHIKTELFFDPESAKNKDRWGRGHRFTFWIPGSTNVAEKIFRVYLEIINEGRDQDNEPSVHITFGKIEVSGLNGESERTEFSLLCTIINPLHDALVIKWPDE